MSERQPKGELCVRTLAMPGDTNPNGDIFGGWVLSQMDIAGGIYSGKRCQGRTVTVAVDSMTFHRPVLVGDVVCGYCETVKEGNTSLAVKIEAWVIRRNETERTIVTEGVFTYVAVDENRKPRSIDSSEND
ncbi:acyl-CoA thioesterase [Halobacteriovorax sp. GB3]|uniref:acyl-CoA thioesterase n=1 Tax=Halobacteriovorax sp. GB3 TaxID=2719615 RepID=UPI002362171B|nr:acyl-CoA thioesterase [Halobacteriovorax sp. GB3]MDD0853440.1 acyl-CoA thioesterase [Halobacteriovorax sp. GB3]